MNIEAKEVLRQKIIKAIAETKQKIQRQEEEVQPIAPENAIGRVSRMDAINNKGVAEAALRRIKEKLAKLQFALSKIDDENFGACSRCKRPIQPMRLMYMPESTQCIRCAR